MVTVVGADKLDPEGGEVSLPSAPAFTLLGLQLPPEHRRMWGPIRIRAAGACLLVGISFHLAHSRR